jgi:hypothetical protein
VAPFTWSVEWHNSLPKFTYKRCNSELNQPAFKQIGKWNDCHEEIGGIPSLDGASAIGVADKSRLTSAQPRIDPPVTTASRAINSIVQY